MDARLVLCGHGGFGTGLHGALTLLCGGDGRVRSLDFREGDSFDELCERMEGLVAENAGAPTGICTDVKGGSPFKASVLTRMKHPEVRLVTGTNFPVLMELMFPAKEPENVDALVAGAVAAARGALTSFEM